MVKKLVTINILLALIFQSYLIYSQVAWLTPHNPGLNDTVVLTYNAGMGNKALQNWDGDIYFHTGAITNKSIDGGDWKHIIGNWGEEDDRTRMVGLGNNLFEFRFVITDFYNIRNDEQVQQLAFVFRNGDGSRVGKTSRNEDIFLPVNGYTPPAVKPKEYLYNSRRYISHINIGDSIIDILTDRGITRIIPYNKNTFEVKHYPVSIPGVDSSHSIILEPQKPLISIIDNHNWLRIITDSLSLAIHKNPYYLSFIYRGDTIATEEMGYFRRSDIDGLRFSIEEDEKIFGLGERANGLNLVGGKYNLYNRPKYGYEIGAKNLNYSVPLVVSSKKYLLLFDNPQKGYADVAETEKGILEFAAIGGTMKYVLVAGSNFKSISKRYSELTGFQPLPPIWALGNLQSRMGYRSQTETDSIADLTIQEGFPLDAMIIDLYWFGDSLQGTMGRLEWYQPNWPEPEKMIKGLKEKGIKTVLITEPYILDSLSNFRITDSLGLLAVDSNGNSYVNKEFYFGQGALLDIFKEEAGNWFWEKYKDQMNIGIEGWWGDLGEPENHPSDQIHILGSADEVHNIYGHYWHKAIFENFRKDYPNRRLFNLNRAGFAGSQRYSIYPWTGDVSRSWGGLQAQIPLMIHMGLCGLPAIHSDAGGFAQGAKDDELYTRWLQMSCFSPILRPHGSGIPSEPVYFSEKTKIIVRDFMKIRYRLLPYIYTLYAESKINGYPIVRSLFYEFPSDSITYNIDNEYMFGDDILVYPVVKQGQESANIYLPKGEKWYNYWSNYYYDGGKFISQKLELKTIPVFIKAGAFIPSVPFVPTTDNYSTQSLTFTYYFDHSNNVNTYVMFDDDRQTFGTVESEDYRLLKIEKKKVSDGIYMYEFAKSGLGYSTEPDSRKVTLEIIGLNKSNVRTFLLNDKELTLINNVTNKESGYYYDEKRKIWVVIFVWNDDKITITQKGKIK